MFTVGQVTRPSIIVIAQADGTAAETMNTFARARQQYRLQLAPNPPRRWWSQKRARK